MSKIACEEHLLFPQSKSDTGSAPSSLGQQLWVWGPGWEPQYSRLWERFLSWVCHSPLTICVDNGNNSNRLYFYKQELGSKYALHSWISMCCVFELLGIWICMYCVFELLGIWIQECYSFELCIWIVVCMNLHALCVPNGALSLEDSRNQQIWLHSFFFNPSLSGNHFDFLKISSCDWKDKKSQM